MPVGSSNATSIKLRTLRHAGDAGHAVTGLRELLQTYVDQVMALARDGGN
jgi:hypothetical protein